MSVQRVLHSAAGANQDVGAAMVVVEMPERECRKRLEGTNIARLGCARDNQPYIVPIRVDCSDGYLYGYATLGAKIEWMRQNPLVCVEVDDFSSPWNWTSVIVFGHYEELPATPGFEGPRAIAARLFQRHPMWWEPSSVPLAGHEQRPSIVFRIRIDRVSGRKTVHDVNAAMPPSPGGPPPRRERWLHRLVGRLTKLA